MSYSKDFREKVFEIKRKEKLSTESVAERFGISSRSIFRWKYKPEPSKTRKKAATKINMGDLKKDIKINPDAYLEERAERLKVSISCVFYALKRLKVTYKKNTYSSKERRRITSCI